MAAEFRERRAREKEARRQQVKAAIAAPKPVGQMVCSLDKWIGVVEQNEGDRIKVSIIGRAKPSFKFLPRGTRFEPFDSGEYLMYKGHSPRFDIDTADEGKTRWMDNSKLGVCDIEIHH